jgi:hypothetical protein
MREEELKIRIGQNYFQGYDTANIIGNIDFCVTEQNDSSVQYLWTKAKNSPADIYRIFTQLFLTCKKELDILGLDKEPPKYFGCFDTEKIAFVEYYDTQIIWSLNDFDRTERPFYPGNKNISQVKKYLSNIQVFHFATDC